MKLPFLKPSIQKRAALIVVALVAAAGVVMGREKPAIEVIESNSPRIEKAAVAFDIDLDKLNRSGAIAPQNDPFAPRSFAPAAQHAGAPAAPAGPSTPPLPFKYFGRLIENGKLEVFVMRGDDVLSIAAGQKIDNDYRVERISDSTISFTYLPLKTRQTMDLVEDNG